MAWLLKALVFVKDPDWFLAPAPVQRLTPIHGSSSRGSIAPFWPLSHQALLWYTDTYKQSSCLIHINLFKNGLRMLQEGREQDGSEGIV